MMALSIRQPWAHNILHDGKDIENRDNLKNYRGPFLIHASRTIEPFWRAHIKSKDMPLGGIVGMAEIVDCVTKSDSKWFVGKYGFVLSRVQELPFMPCKGKLSFFVPDIKDQVVKLYKDAVLSEGQASKILSIHRIELRKMSDEQEGRENG